MSRLAIASLVCSLLWVYGLASLVGVVLGIAAVRRLPADAPPGRERGRPLAVAGLALGLVGIVVTGVLLVLAVQALEDVEYPM